MTTTTDHHGSSGKQLALDIFKVINLEEAFLGSQKRSHVKCKMRLSSFALNADFFALGPSYKYDYGKTWKSFSSLSLSFTFSFFLSLSFSFSRVMLSFFFSHTDSSLSLSLFLPFSPKSLGKKRTLVKPSHKHTQLYINLPRR